jgi:hypothetical protein
MVICPKTPQNDSYLHLFGTMTLHNTHTDVAKDPEQSAAKYSTKKKA